MKTPILRLGTRQSPLALAQTKLFVDAIQTLNPTQSIEVIPINTTADRFVNTPLYKIGGKGLFIKELENALLEGKIDMALHSMKDVPDKLPEGLALSSVLPREDMRDCLVSPKFQNFDQFPQQARIGTSSFRRKLLLERIRPDFQVVMVRGNVQSRLAKIETLGLDGVVLAAAGINRLGLTDKVSFYLAEEAFLPALTQGILAVEFSPAAFPFLENYPSLIDPKTHLAYLTERTFLQTLEGNCFTPVAGYARVDGQQTIQFSALLMAQDPGDDLHEQAAGKTRSL